MITKGSMTIVLVNGVKIVLDYDRTLYDTLIASINSYRYGDTITLEGRGWPMSVAFPVSDLDYIETTSTERIHFERLDRDRRQNKQDD